MDKFDWGVVYGYVGCGLLSGVSGPIWTGTFFIFAAVYAVIVWILSKVFR